MKDTAGVDVASDGITVGSMTWFESVFKETRISSASSQALKMAVSTFVSMLTQRLSNH